MTTIGIFFVFVIPIWLKMTTIGNFPKSAIPSKYGRKYKNFIPYFLEENTRILFQEKKQFAKLAAAIQWRLQILHPLNPHNNITCEHISRQHAQRFTSPSNFFYSLRWQAFKTWQNFSQELFSWVTFNSLHFNKTWQHGVGRAMTTWVL